MASRTITIDRPDAGQLPHRARCATRSRDRFDELSATLGVRAVVLTGAGDRHFCTGAGLGGAAEADAAPARGRARAGARRRRPHDPARLAAARSRRSSTARSRSIAAVNGTAAGGGANLVLACDLVVMADTARLIEVFVRRGIIPDAGGCYLLPRIVGPQRAKELHVPRRRPLGGRLRARRASPTGSCRPPSWPRPPTSSPAGSRRRPSKAIAMTKWLVNRSFESSRHTAFEEEAYAQELVGATADMAEGIARLRRAPRPRVQGLVASGFRT